MNSLVNKLPSLHRLLYITAAVLSHYEILSHELSERSVGVGGGVHIGHNVQIDFDTLHRIQAIIKYCEKFHTSQRVSLFHLLVTLSSVWLLRKVQMQHIYFAVFCLAMQ